MKIKLVMWLVLLVSAVVALRQNVLGQDAQPPSQPPGRTNPVAGNGPIDKGLRVFTAGHSFHAFFIAPILKNMADDAGLTDHQIVGISKIPASKAIDHWNKNAAKADLQKGNVDVLTLTCMMYPDDGIEKFAAYGLQYNPNFRISLQESWLPWDLDEWPLKSRPESAINFDAATFPNLRDLHAAYFKRMDDYVIALNAKLGKQVVYVAPCAQALLLLREKIIAGQVPGIPKQSDLFVDKNGHPNLPMQAMIGYVHFAVIYRRTPVGLPLPEILVKAHKPQWDDKMNLVLQQVAWDAVIHHPLSGVTEKK